MGNHILERGEYFNLAQESVQTGLKNLFGRNFGSLEEIAEALKGITPSVYIAKEISVKTRGLLLPYELRECPIYGLILDDPEPEEVAKVRIV
jgi:hypothetical protein